MDKTWCDLHAWLVVDNDKRVDRAKFRPWLKEPQHPTIELYSLHSLKLQTVQS